ncbi:glucose-1-phosphate adenylyltransferase [Bryobacter aggregatus]|uniref:glucose-1-phosphate adenylyltransferase n=1 Tax=Bryobacter aggregatus TaxID=360054 RepID=UPI000560F33C|nr:glucose-1-phosphate adenylyltransferase [Bryobacter aggregatus]
MDKILAILLAGGAGERLSPLTRNTAKPAVPFGGIYRIIDFTLSNCLNSGLRQIYIMTQYKSLDLTRHIRDGWAIFSGEIGEFIETMPPMKRMHDDWYLGTADAVYQNIESIEAEAPESVLILSADHIYKMNYSEMRDWHRRQQADITIATIQIAPEEAGRFGVAQINPSYRIIGFEEKPAHGHPARSPFDPSMVSASMGIYLFNTKILLDALRTDAADPHSSHDFGKDILPKLIHQHKVSAYDFHDLNAKRVRYWRDVGTLDAYYDANIDLVSVIPEFNLYDKAWPIRTNPPMYPPAKFVLAYEGTRMGVAIDSVVAPGVIVSGARVQRSVLSPGVRVNSYTAIDDSILLSNAEIGRHCHLRRTIVCPNVRIPEGTRSGFDRTEDLARGYTVTESGITVIA